MVVALWSDMVIFCSVNFFDGNELLHGHFYILATMYYPVIDHLV